MKTYKSFFVALLGILAFSCHTSKPSGESKLIAAKNRKLNTESYSYSVVMYSFGSPQKVYAEPSVKSAVLGTVVPNTKLIISYLEDNAWCAFYYNGKVAYLQRSNLQYTPVATATTPPPKTNTNPSGEREGYYFPKNRTKPVTKPK